MLSVIIGAVWVLLDFVTKYWVRTGMTELQEIKIIPGFFSLQFVHNTGASFGMLSNQRWLFILVASAVVVALIYYAFQKEARQGRLVPWALGFIMGGAAGNLVDRIRWGKVVDFLMFYHKSYVFPNFNVADIGITIGVALLILHLLLNGEKKPREGA